MPKKKWEQITADYMEKACGDAIRRNDVLIINTGWHKRYEDGDYFPYCPGLVSSAAEWMLENGVKVVGHDTQANDNPLATAIGPAAQWSAAAAPEGGESGMVRWT